MTSQNMLFLTGETLLKVSSYAYHLKICHISVWKVTVANCLVKFLYMERISCTCFILMIIEFRTFLGSISCRFHFYIIFVYISHILQLNCQLLCGIFCITAKCFIFFQFICIHIAVFQILGINAYLRTICIFYMFAIYQHSSLFVILV